jgi:RsiW-degrading membrane proteinase PrsW (M82 family)
LEKLILLSIVLFTAGFPIILSRHPVPRRAIRLLPFLTVIAAFLWAYACRRWYPQLVSVE